MAAIVGAIVIFVTVGVSVIVSVRVVPVMVVTPVVIAVIAKRVFVTVTATYPKSKGETS